MTGGSKMRRSTAESLDALLDLATQRLITHSLDALAGLVTPSTLARSSHTVSVDTAYRLLGSPERTIELLAERVITPEFASDALAWPTFGDVFEGVIDSYSALDSLDGAHASLRALIANNFVLPSVVVGRLVAAATLTASESWTGEIRLRDEQLEVARAIRAAIRTMVHTLDGEFARLLRIVLVELRRRPTAGRSVDHVAVLLRTLVDGAVDRMLLDPGSMTIDDVASATMDLGFALTEDGLLPEITGTFGAPDDFPLESVLLTAEQQWSADRPPANVLAAVADTCGITTGEIEAVFADEAGLADAVVRALVLCGPITGSRESRFAMVSTALRRLAHCADTAPRLLAAIGSDPDTGALADLGDEIGALAALRSSTSPEADRLADQLLASARKGMAHWDSTTFLLELLKD